MALTDTQAKAAKPREKTWKLFDTGGLYLEIRPNGGKSWRFRYTLHGKEKKLGFGIYPAVSLKDARARRDEARVQLDRKIDPGALAKETRQATSSAAEGTFEVVAQEWMLLRSDPKSNAKVWTPDYALLIKRRLEADVFPYMGSSPVGEIKPKAVLEVIRRIAARGALETAHRALQTISEIFRYSVGTDRAESDPTRDLRGIALPAAKTRHHAAVTEPDHVAALLRAIKGYRGSPIVRVALQLAPLVFVRPGELRQARWYEFQLDGDAPAWSIPAERMKMREAHLVPLSRQAVALLRELHPLTGNRATSDLVFRGARDHERPMSENTLSMALESLGYYNGDADPHGAPVPIERRHSPHGFRATARTLLDERLKVRVDLIEHQLAHAVRDPLGRAYNRTRFLDERRAMMQRWGDYLEGLVTPAKVIRLDEQSAAPSEPPARRSNQQVESERLIGAQNT